MPITFQQSLDDVARLVKQFNTNRAAYMAAAYKEAVLATSSIRAEFAKVNNQITLYEEAEAPAPLHTHHG